MTAKEIMAELKPLGGEGYKRILMRNYGVKEPCFGVKIADLKKFQKRIKTNYQLALDLYDTGNYDAMYLAGLIADDKRMTQKDLQHWVEKAHGGALAGSTVAWVAAARHTRSPVPKRTASVRPAPDARPIASMHARVDAAPQTSVITS